MSENATTDAGLKLSVGRDFRSARGLVKRLRCSESLADLVLTGRRRARRFFDAPLKASRRASTTTIPVRVTPAAFDGSHAEILGDGGDELHAVATYVSRKEVDFLHDQALAGSFAIVTVDLPDGLPLSLVLEIQWLNIERRHTYMTGGRFVGIVDTGEAEGPHGGESRHC